MIRTMYWDTAITGRFFYKEPLDGRAQPHLCRLAMLIENGRAVVAEHVMLIKPLLRWTFEPDAVTGHHITPEIAREYGVPLAEAWELFTTELEKADVAVAFNFDHHWQVMRAIGWHDLGKKLEKPERLREMCLQRRAASIVRVPDPSETHPFIRPKFHHCYNHFIDEPPPLILDPAEFGSFMVNTMRTIWHGVQFHKPKYRSVDAI